MLSTWWVVYKVNPYEQLSTPDDSGYHENQVPTREVDGVYQDDELSCSFNIDPDSALNSLLGNANNVTVFKQRKQDLRKKKYKILNVLYILYYVPLYFILYSCYIILRSLYFFHTMFWMNTQLCLF
jgi:hypothetical protein